jgi:hypothetical protein
MNRELLKQMGQAAIDFANGESVQYLYLTQWIDIDETHCFCPDKKYRTKPKPRIIWAVYLDKYSGVFYEDKDRAIRSTYGTSSQGSPIAYRELTEEERRELEI